MSNYGIKIAKAGFDTATVVPKNQIFNSSLACLKILQIGKQSAVNASEITFIAVVAFPIVLLVFLYNSVTSKYEPIEAEFDSTKIYLPGGEAANSYYYYFVCYA